MKTKLLMAVAAATLLSISASAKPLYGKAGIVIRDGATGAPIPGVKVTIRYGDPTETRKEKIKVDRNSGDTDDKGYVEPRTYLGTDDGTMRSIEVQDVVVLAEKPGYKPFEGKVGIFYSAFLRAYEVNVFLDEVVLAPEGSALESRVEPQGLHPEVSVDPAWGDYKTQYTVKVKIKVPAVLTHEFDKTLMRVSIMGASTDAKKPDVELSDDGKKPDEAKNDAVFTGIIKPIQSNGLSINEKIAVLLRTKDDFHRIMSEPGQHFRWTESRTTITLFTTGYRWVTVMATVSDLPVKWVVADTVDEAKKAYDEKFGPAVRTTAER